MIKIQENLPWSIWMLGGWLAAFFLLSFILGICCFYTIGFLDQKLSLELNPAERYTYIYVTSHFFYYCAIGWFIYYMLKRNSLVVRDIIGSLPVPPHQILFGCLLGILLMTGQIIGHKLAYGFYWDPPEYEIGLGWISIFALELIVLGLFPGFVEEVVFRGLLYSSLRKSMTYQRAGLISSFCFLAFHISFIHDYVFVVYILSVGLVAAWLFERNKSLIPSICFHVVGNVFERTIYYYMFYF